MSKDVDSLFLSLGYDSQENEILVVVIKPSAALRNFFRGILFLNTISLGFYLFRDIFKVKPIL